MLVIRTAKTGTPPSRLYVSTLFSKKGLRPDHSKCLMHITKLHGPESPWKLVRRTHAQTGPFNWFLPLNSIYLIRSLIYIYTKEPIE